jgi:hypothetical protein
MTTSMLLASAIDDTGNRVVLQLGTLALMLWVVRNGAKTWRGEEPRRIEHHERTVGPWRSTWGTRRKYRTELGSGYLGVVFGAGFVVFSATDLVRMALGRSDDWGPWWAAGYVGAVLWTVGVAGLMSYFWVGLPDRLRPPCQRGWEVVDGELVLVRPGRTAEERADRQPITVGPASGGPARRRGPALPPPLP